MPFITGIKFDRTVYKIADEIVNNSVTLQNDDELFFSIGANENWYGKIVCVENSSAVANMRLRLVPPSGTAYLTATNDQGGGSARYVRWDNADYVQTTSGSDLTVHFEFLIRNGATAGVVNLKWAQGTQEASNSTMKIGSNLWAIRL
jgi:hypothetical protein